MIPICVGHTCHSVWAFGFVSVTANGQTVQATHMQGSTPASVASALCSGMTSSFPLQCTGTTSNGNTATLSVQASSNIPISTACRVTNGSITGCLFGATVSGFFNPTYMILAVLYTPPGDASSNGFANTNSTGVSSTIGTNFSSGDTETFSASGGLLGQGSLGVSFGVSTSTGDTQAFQVTYSNGNGTQLLSNQQNIDHTQDQFYLWLNPQVTVNSTFNPPNLGLTTSSTAATYGVTTQDGVGSDMDIVNVNAAGLQNPSLIPLAILLPQTLRPGVVVPGLANICAHPLPPDQCTQANACGCVPSDFAAILAADPLIGVSQTTPPTQVASPNRFVFVESQILEGPEQAGGGRVVNSFTASDATLQSTTFTQSVTDSTSFSTGSGINIPFLFTLTITDTNTFSVTHSQSQGTQNGTAHQASVSLGSDKVQCFEHVDIYEDTVYHTFAFALPAAPPPACQ
jgi:hypothetical protein